MYKLKEGLEKGLKDGLLSQAKELISIIEAMDIYSECDIENMLSVGKEFSNDIFMVAYNLGMLSTINNKEDRELFFEEVVE